MEFIPEFIPVVILIALVVFTIVWAISPKMAGKAAIKTFAYIVAILLVASMLAIPGIVRADELEGKIVFITPTINEQGEPVAIVDIDTDDGSCWQYEAKGRIAVEGKVVLTVIDGKVVAVEDVKEETPNQLPLLIGIPCAVVFFVVIVKSGD